MRNGVFEICADIVDAALGGARKSQLVHRANLNFVIIRKYLSMLLGSGLLVEDPPFFGSTEKGEEFLCMFDVVSSLVVPGGFDGLF